MAKFSYNPFNTKNLDMVQSKGEIAVYDLRYLKLDTSNDPLTGELVITPAVGTTALRANKNITLKSGQKLIFDGA